MILGLMTALGFGAYAQSTDLSAYVYTEPADGKVLTPHQTLTTLDGDEGDFIMAIGMQSGSDAIVGGDYTWYITPFVEQGYMSGFAFTDNFEYDSEYDNGLGMITYNFPNEQELGSGHTGPNQVNSDSIKVLYDWDQYNLHDSIVEVVPPFVDGESYGFFFGVQAIGYIGTSSTGSDSLIRTATDPNPGDNLDVVRIVWNGSTGIKSLFPAKEKAGISIYPNPTTTDINFEFQYTAPSHAKAFVRDVTGRVVDSKQFGRALPGVQKYKMDVSKLAPGIYTLEFNTDEVTATTKFTVGE